MISIQKLTKVYGNETVAVDNISLEISKGKIYGLLGRNGSGKTTLLNIITNRIFATSGRVLIDGESSIENDTAQGKIFCMTEKGSYPSDMKVEKAFYWAKKFYPDFDTDYALELSKKFGLNIKKRINALSTGYGSIAKLIMTLSSNAPVLIFDEPVLGLDAGMRDLFYKELMAQYIEKGGTIIISTHLIEEVADILENAIIIKDGKIIADSPVEDLRSRAYIVTGQTEKALNYANGKRILHCQTVGRLSVITIDGICDSKEKESIKQAGLDYSTAKLQEIFVKLTSKEGQTHDGN